MTDELKSVWNDFLSFALTLNCMKNSEICFCWSNRGNEVRPVKWLFCDSYTDVYCAVIYICVETSSGVKLSFLASKTKVVPMNALNVRCLELLGCLLLSQLINSIVTEVLFI